MAFIEPPQSYNAQSKLYMRRLYNSLVQEIQNATSLPVVSNMPVNPKQGAYYFQNAIPGDPTITQPGIYGFNGSNWVGNMDVQQWPSARIANLSADKITSGTNTAAEIILNGVNAKLRSNNYVTGSTGFQIKGDGSAEFQNVTVRGTLNANDIQAGYLNPARLQDDTLGAGPIIGGAIHYQAGNASDLSLPNSTSTTIVSGSYASGAVNVPANPLRTSIVIILTAGNITMNGTTTPCTAANGGHILAQIARGSTTGLISGSQAFMSFAPYAGSSPGPCVNQGQGFATSICFEPVGTTGTGSLNYYLRAHQCVIASGNVSCRVSWTLIEFSKA